MLNLRPVKLAVCDCSIFKNPKQNNVECIALTLCDFSVAPLDRKCITIFDVYEGNDVYHALVKDLLSCKAPFPIVALEGSFYGYGKRFNLARYNGIVNECK